MKLKLLLLFALLIVSGVTFSQQRECAAMDVLANEIQQDPSIEDRMRQIEIYTQSKISEIQQNREINGSIITIPVVVHVLYHNSTTNISDAQVLSQIDVLNEDFRRTNADADGTWPQAADVEIEFCMANVDPNGNSTTGITRTAVSNEIWITNDNYMKSAANGGVDAWDTSQYLNMWVVPELRDNIGRVILGYAQFPGGNAATDGVVMADQYFGRIGTVSAPFNLGRTTTHEVGHFLNLRHIWGDGNCSFDDFVTDTPESDAPNYGCSPTHVSCSTTDMVQNYMDYSDDSCMNLFTQGQTDRMRVQLLPGGSRASLGASTKCSGGGTTPTCSDGIQNGNETGVDCGGPDCAPCQTACQDNEVNLSITFDNYPEETAWTLTDDGGQTIASGGTYGSQPDGSTLTEDFCLPDGCYTFTITDTYGDGICCSYGNGSYTLTGPSGTLASGGSFGSSEATPFCLGATPEPTCDDGIQNGDETGVDCGGSTCAPCSTGGSDVLLEGYFESGWDGWQDGGSDCARYSGSRSYEGSYSIRIRDNSGTASAMTSPSLDVSSYNQVEVDFHFYSYSMENNEDFWLRYYNGSSWVTVATWARGTDFENNNFYNATVVLDAANYNFVSNAQFRFQCDASGNADQIYIDQVVITGLNSGSGSRLDGNEIVLVGSLETGNGADEISDFVVVPNPVSGNTISIKTVGNELSSKYVVKNILGQTVISGKLTNDTIDVSHLRSGIYFVEMSDGDEIYVKKFIRE